MSRVAFEVVDLHVSKMYNKKFDENDIEGIHKHCESIAEFMKACGWTEEEFVRESIHRSLDEVLGPDTKEIN